METCKNVIFVKNGLHPEAADKLNNFSQIPRTLPTLNLMRSRVWRNISSRISSALGTGTKLGKLNIGRIESVHYEKAEKPSEISYPNSKLSWYLSRKVWCWQFETGWHCNLLVEDTTGPIRKAIIQKPVKMLYLWKTDFTQKLLISSSKASAGFHEPCQVSILCRAESGKTSKVESLQHLLQFLN